MLTRNFFFITCLYFIGFSMGFLLESVKSTNQVESVKSTNRMENTRTRRLYEYIRQDDMILPKSPSGKAGLADPSYNWPNGVLPYVFDSTVLNQETLRDNIITSQEEISRFTCITFRPAVETDTYWINYRINPDEPDCSSYVGFQNVPNQDINLNIECTKGAIIHETLHALGFLHEQTREDRDDYVKIIYENIIQSPTNLTFNFQRDDELGYATEYFGVPYNYESIMHYPPNAFSINWTDPEKNTIVAVQQAEGVTPALGDPSKMGQSQGLTDGDIKMVNRKYCSHHSDTETTEVTQSESTNDPEISNPTPGSDEETTTDLQPEPQPEETSSAEELATSSDTATVSSEVTEEVETTSSAASDDSVQTTQEVTESSETSGGNSPTTTASETTTSKGPPFPKPPCIFPMKPPFC